MAWSPAYARRSNTEMQEFGYSTEQYEILEQLTSGRPVTEQGAPVDGLEQFIRLRLREGPAFGVVASLTTFAEEALALLTAREARVQRAWKDVARNGAITFPEERKDENVFTAGGRWGEHASALTDAALRGKYFALQDRINAAIALFDARPGDVDLAGLNANAIWNHADLAVATLQAKKRIWGDARFDYRDSAGKPITLSVLDVERRIFDLSFDPNHPPEVRWGAPPDSATSREARSRPTPVTGGYSVPMAESYRKEAYYRSLTRWEPDPSYLRTMFTEGFAIRDRMDAQFTLRWLDKPSPPLVPHGGRAAWLAEEATVIRR